MAKRRAVLKPAESEAGARKRDPRQLEIGVPPPADPPVTRMPAAPPPDAAAVLARRAVARRGVDAGRVVLRITIKQATAETLATCAIREGRNLEDVAAEIVERAADE